MQDIYKDKTGSVADFFLDITAEVCPMTFVKTKLTIEKMRPGEVLAIRLKGSEPLDNVPRNLRDHGHEVLSLESEETEESGGPEHPAEGVPHCLRVRVGGKP